MPKLPKLSLKEIKLKKKIVANNKSAVKRIKKAKDAKQAIKLLEDYFSQHGKIPRA